METHVYRLEPIADPDDQNWDRATNQGVVYVRALSPGDARVVAAHAEAAAITLQPTLSTIQVRASAFRDEKLYHVVRDESGLFPDAGPRALLQAMFEVPPGYVTATD